MTNLYLAIYQAIMEPDPRTKCAMVLALYNDYRAGDKLSIANDSLVLSIPNAGTPQDLELVHPLKVPKRSQATDEGKAALVHALAHIEFNAINLALDAVYRFRDMPDEYISNWLEVAKEEAYHFELLNNHMANYGYTYADFPAHNGLWDMAYATESNLLDRMAMVPRLLEARGLDAIPNMQEKIRRANNQSLVEILDIIHRDEIKHVSYGDRWFKYACAKLNLEPQATYFGLMDKYNAPIARGKINRHDRAKAGFSEHELDWLSNRK